MAQLISARALGDVLIELGLVPANCQEAKLILKATGAIRLRYEVAISADDLPKLSQAFAMLQDRVGKP